MVKFQFHTNSANQIHLPIMKKSNICKKLVHYELYIVPVTLAILDMNFGVYICKSLKYKNIENEHKKAGIVSK